MHSHEQHKPRVAHPDGREGLGYGQVKNRFQKPRKSTASYPYLIDDFDSEGFEDEESADAIHNKVPAVYVTDFGAAGKSDPFYFAGGNTKLSDAFFRTERIIEEMATFSDSMSPMPYIYKGKQATSQGRGSGSSFPSGVGSFKRTGTRRGYSASPPLSKIAAVLSYEEEENDDQEALTLKDLAKAKTFEA